MIPCLDGRMRIGRQVAKACRQVCANWLSHSRIEDHGRPGYKFPTKFPVQIGQDGRGSGLLLTIPAISATSGSWTRNSGGAAIRVRLTLPNWSMGVGSCGGTGVEKGFRYESGGGDSTLQNNDQRIRGIGPARLG